MILEVIQQASPYCSPFCDEDFRTQQLLGARHVGYATVVPSVVKISTTAQTQTSAAAVRAVAGEDCCWTYDVAVTVGFAAV